MTYLLGNNDLKFSYMTIKLSSKNMCVLVTEYFVTANSSIFLFLLLKLNCLLVIHLTNIKIVLLKSPLNNIIFY